ncbi:Ldh family oxidoreductase [uncultured Pigmentiphaga sp.]|uniref:Ldh family oxidoreductase n=1 Tax=uncultured Pigmentiphaga sp. TaxID=340361 RepID=UPI002602372E|nr:Ldh family oxidoreductase [uncultured Pigmentiphaga sp.]
MGEPTVVRIPEDELLALATQALVRCGMAQAAAREAARILVLADLLGLATHGVSRIESYGERLKLGGIAARPEISLERVAQTLARLDGGNGVGPLVGMRALEAAMQMTRENGVGIVFARGSNHFGPIAPYAYLAAQEGFASMICSNATLTITPWGGREARLGNNPIGFGIPNPAGQPVILDMAISVAARAKIRQALQRGEPIPPTWATDADGRPTSDPRAALAGFLLPMGGHKGYGLALIVDLLAGLLSGAAYLTHVKSWVDAPDSPQNLGHFFLLFDTARLGSPEWLAQRMTDFRAILVGTPPVDPERPVLLPGDIEMAKLMHQREHGIELPAETYEMVKRYAA